MDENEFEGTAILEKLAEIAELEAFFEAIDADNFAEAKRLMLKAGVDLQTIKFVLNKMADADGEH